MHEVSQWQVLRFSNPIGGNFRHVLPRVLPFAVVWVVRLISEYKNYSKYDPSLLVLGR